MNGSGCEGENPDLRWMLLEEFKRVGCTVTFVHRPLSDNPNDQLLLQIQSAVAEYERAVLGERFRPRQTPEGPQRSLVHAHLGAHGVEHDVAVEPLDLPVA